MKSKSKTSVDLHQKITDTIIDLLEAGTVPWQSGRSGSPALPLRHNNEPYNGINVLLLWNDAAYKGYVNPNWMTYRQAKEYGGQVRKDEKSSMAVFASAQRTVEDESGETQILPGFLKRFAVFNADQIDDLPASFYAAPPPQTYSHQRIEHIDAFLAAIGVRIDFHPGPAHFESTDNIGMPLLERYETINAYYHDLFHELIHWTRVPSRLDRNFGRKKKGDAGYAKEELVAEIGANFLLAHFGITTTEANSASYIEGWLSAMRNDKRFITSAASHASKAFAYLLILAGESRTKSA